MKQLIIIIFSSLLIIYITKYIAKQIRRLAYQKAGKKWDVIVKELSERK